MQTCEDEEAPFFEGSVRYLMSKAQIDTRQQTTGTSVIYSVEACPGLLDIAHLFPDSYIVGHTDPLPGVVNGMLPSDAAKTDYELLPTGRIEVSDIEISIKETLDLVILKNARGTQMAKSLMEVPDGKKGLMLF